jgi:hypothetical protein
MNQAERTRRRQRAHPREAMSVAEAFSVLGLPPSAGRELVHATYRRLALEHHPDHNPGDETSYARFKTLATAHRVLQHKFDLDEYQLGKRPGECEHCGRYDLLRTALDGSHCCMQCLSLANARRQLPAPPIVIATCATTIVLLVLAVVCFAVGCTSRGIECSIASFSLGVAALVSLAVTCVTIRYTAVPSRRPRRRAPTAAHATALSAQQRTQL